MPAARDLVTLAALTEEKNRLVRENWQLRHLLYRLRQWDHLPVMGDGPYWVREITAALGDSWEPYPRPEV